MFTHKVYVNTSTDDEGRKKRREREEMQICPGRNLWAATKGQGLGEAHGLAGLWHLVGAVQPCLLLLMVVADQRNQAGKHPVLERTQTLVFWTLELSSFAQADRGLRVPFIHQSQCLLQSILVMSFLLRLDRSLLLIP